MLSRKPPKIKQYKDDAAKGGIPLWRHYLLLLIVILAVGYDQRKIGRYECELDTSKIVEEFQNEKEQIREEWEARRCYNLKSCREFLREYME